MDLHRVKQGYNLPILGEAEQKLEQGPKMSSIGVQPIEFHGLKPRLLVKVGDSVKIGSPLFQDKNRPDILFASPASGKVSDIQYGPRRVIEAIRITPAGEDHEQFQSYRPEQVSSINKDELKELLLKAGMWPLIRQRPFDKVANPEDEPSSIFVNCMDTAPLAADPEFSLQGRGADFKAGIEALKILGKVHVVVDGKRKDSMFLSVDGVEKHGFVGKHPAGNVGTHIARIDPVIKPGKVVWYLNAREVVRLGSFLLVGQYPSGRTIALAGAGLTKNHYLNTVVGANIGDLTAGLAATGDQRFISGNVLTGRHVATDEYLGFYDNEITVIPEDPERHFIGWMLPGFTRPSYGRAFMSAIRLGARYNMGTNANGEPRALVKTGDYQKVMGMDVLPDYLVKAILAEDIDQMEQLGILEVAPEDVALCSYICPSKTEFTSVIQEGLDLMEQEIS